MDYNDPSQFPRQNQPYAPPYELSAESEAAFFQKVYFWMCGGLAVTAAVAWQLSRSDAWMNFLIGTRGAVLIVFVVQIGLVVALNAMIKTFPANAVRFLFLLFAASMGATVSLLLRVYPGDIIVKAFLSTCFVYGGMAAYGLLTRKSLQKWGAFLFMGLIGLIASSLVNLFFARSPFMDYVICWFGVVVFAGLTAYDHQKLRVVFSNGFSDEEAQSKCVILGACELYLDFINLFIYLVRILGARR